MNPNSSSLATRECPICLSPQARALHAQKFVLPPGHPLREGYHVARCVSCGFVYADTSATQRDYDRFYAQLSKYEEGSTATGSGEEPWDAERLEITARCIAQFWPDKDARLLDIGCANGGLLLCLRELGYTRLGGLDPSPVCAAHVRERGLEAHVGTLSDLPGELEAGSFDGVILSHVLEHVRDVRPCVERIAGLLRSDGRFYVEVPDAARYESFYISPFHFFDTEHINHFAAPSLANLLRLSGFDVVARGHKETPVTEGVPYPALWMVGEKQLASTCADIGEIDEELGAAIGRYIERSRLEFDPTIVDALATEGRPVIVWGVGCSTMRLLANSALGRANIVAFADNNPKTWNTSLADRPVIAPSELSARGEAILITSRLYASQIEHQIRHELKLENEVLRSFANELAPVGPTSTSSCP